MPVNLQTEITTTYLAPGTEYLDVGRIVKASGEDLKSGRMMQLIMPWNIPHTHWLLLDINITTRKINIGDSYPKVTRPHLANIIAWVQAWLQEYVPGTPFTTMFQGFGVRLQEDSHSCGLAMSNSIHQQIDPSAPSWNLNKPGKGCAFYFIRCVEFGLGIELLGT
jgi:hypothetical protein